MKSIKYILLFIAAGFITGCGDEFLEQKNLTEKLDDSYYRTASDISEALAGAYSCLPTEGGVTNPTLLDNLMSDDCLGGGGINDVGFHNIDSFSNTVEDAYLNLWQIYYKGIFRTNMLIKRFDQAKFDNELAKNQAHGEAYFLRSYFYFTLARFFGTVPLIIDPGPANLPKASEDELFAQIASDMKNAIELMPSTKVTTTKNGKVIISNPEFAGHATKWAAEGMMARIFLFYTGYYNKTEMPLLGGGSIKKEEVISWVDDCIANSGHELVSDYRNLWPYAYANVDYPYAKNNNLVWEGDGNKETVFAVKYSVYANWADDINITYSNQLTLYMGMRGQNGLLPFGTGWGAGPVNPQLLSNFEAGDIRLKASIADVTDPEEGNVSSKYEWGVWECMHETGLWQKKYTPIQIVFKLTPETKDTIKGMYFSIYKNPDDFQRWNMQDEVLLRFSDIMLMGAELGSTNAQSYLDQVRSRVGLPSVAVTLDNIKRERRNELAFEGVRYLDLLRWHDAEKAFALAKNIPVKNLNVDAKYTATYRPDTRGFLPIPESEIRLQGGVLKQNPGWE